MSRVSIELMVECTGSYLGVDIAIKEVLPSTEYDVRLPASPPLPQQSGQSHWAIRYTSISSENGGSCANVDIPISSSFSACPKLQMRMDVYCEAPPCDILHVERLRTFADVAGYLYSIISEYVPRGNLRQFILSAHPFPWRLRLSFATDVARAVAYLHARQVSVHALDQKTLEMKLGRMTHADLLWRLVYPS